MEEEDDTHQCLGCKMVIQGLDNYIQHKKFLCARLLGKKSHGNASGTFSIPPWARDGPSNSKLPESVRDANAERTKKVGSTVSQAGDGDHTEGRHHLSSSSSHSLLLDKDAAETMPIQSSDEDDNLEADHHDPMIMTVECVDEEEDNVMEKDGAQPKSQNSKAGRLPTQSTTRMDFSCKTCGVEFNTTYEIKRHLGSKRHLNKAGCAENNTEKTDENRSERTKVERSESPLMAMTVDCVNDDLSSDDGGDFGMEDVYTKVTNIIRDLEDDDDEDSREDDTKKTDTHSKDVGYKSKLTENPGRENNSKVASGVVDSTRKTREGYCEVCRWDYGHKAQLELHLKTKKHLKAARDAATNETGAKEDGDKSNKSQRLSKAARSSTEGRMKFKVKTKASSSNTKDSGHAGKKSDFVTKKSQSKKGSIKTEGTHNMDDETTGVNSDIESNLQNVEKSTTEDQRENEKEDLVNTEDGREASNGTENNMGNVSRATRKLRKRKKKSFMTDSYSSAVDSDEHSEVSDDSSDKKRANASRKAPRREKSQRTLKPSKQYQKNERKVPCKYCDKFFANTSGLFTHVQIQHVQDKIHHSRKTLLGPPKVDGDNPPYLCHPCRHVAHSREEFDEHCKTMEHVTFEEFYKYLEVDREGYEKYSCTLCEYQTDNKPEAERHVQKHLRDNIKGFPCSQCGKSYPTLRARQRHVVRIHEKDRSHLCNLCGKEFSKYGGLHTHMALHQGLKPHKCTYEGCTFRAHMPSGLKMHMMRHTGEKPFLCDRCSYASVNKQALNRHIRRIHTKPAEKMLKCDHCDYTTQEPTGMQRHLRKHTGEKPYKCPHCSYSCSSHENLKKHIIKTKKHEGKKFYNCKLCDFGINVLHEFFNHLRSTHGLDAVIDYQGSFGGGINQDNMSPRFLRVQASSNPKESAENTDKQDMKVSLAVAAIPEENVPVEESGEKTEPSKAVSVLEEMVNEMAEGFLKKEEDKQEIWDGLQETNA